MMTDANGLRLYLDDVLIDDIGEEWKVSWSSGSWLLEPPEYENDFYLKLSNSFDMTLLTCIRTDHAASMYLKR